MDKKLILTRADFAEAAQALGCMTEAVMAVSYQESADQGTDRPNGYAKDGRMKTLFEAHIFGWKTGHKYDAQYPDLSAADWKHAAQYYNQDQWDRFSRAAALDREAACCSISPGYFQICGFNVPRWGLRPTAAQYIQELLDGDALTQLDMFIEFCRIPQQNETGALTAPAAALAVKNWARFAWQYNGSLYADNHYDSNIANWFTYYIAHPQVLA